MRHHTSPPIIEARGLTKRFGDVQALAGLDLVAEPGQVVAVLGPNGAGKTTFVRSLATLVQPDEGTLRVAGVDAVRHPEQVRRVIGLAGQFAAVEEAMTGRENLHMVARLFGHSRRRAAVNATTVLAQLGLTDAADRLVRTYSGGMRRRLDLGASLVGAPRLLLLDEPTTGLDPRSRNELWEAIRRLVAAGTDVLLTTQYLDEADQLAHRVVIVDKGRVIADGTPGELKSRAGRDVIEVRAHRSSDLPALAGALAAVGVEAPRVHAGTSRVTVPVDGGRAVIAAAVRAVDALGVEVDDIGLRRPTLDEVFLALTGEPIEPIDRDGDDDGAGSPAGAAGPGTDDDHHHDDHATIAERAEPVGVH
jgi:daunorubicin resistance ABC transporter ATP-binding subunit